MVLSATTIVGNRVRSAEGEDLGSIEELMIDLEHGKVAYAVLSFGGFLGLREKYYAVPWPAFRLAPRDNEFVLDVPRSKLENAPGFDKRQWPNAVERDWLTDIYQYYEVEPYWN